MKKNQECKSKENVANNKTNAENVNIQMEEEACLGRNEYIQLF